MQNFNYHIPTRILFGKERHLESGEIVKGYGFKKILFYYGGQSIFKTGLHERISSSLKAAGVDYVEMGGVQPNPTLEFCEKTADFMREKGVDFVLAVGGGSVIDSAKVACMAVGSGIEPAEIMDQKKAPTKAIPIGVVLTIAAAGSETSESSVLTDTKTSLKKGFGSPLNRPLFAIMDPTLTYTLPSYQTACGIVDILMHTFERYFCYSKDNMLADEISEGLLRSVIAAGPIAMKNPTDYEARATLMWAGSLAHNGLTGLGRAPHSMIAHQLEHAMGGLDDKIAHGAGLAITWLGFLRFLQSQTIEIPRLVQYANRVFGVNVEFDHPERAVEEGIIRTENFFRSLGMPVRLSDVGLSEKDIPKLVDLTTYAGTRTLASFKALDADDVKKMFELCL